MGREKIKSIKKTWEARRVSTQKRHIIVYEENGKTVWSCSEDR